MTALTPRIVLWAPLVLLSLARPVRAQDIATSFEQLRGTVAADDTIVVTDAKGGETVGRPGRITSSSLEILVPETGPDGRKAFIPRRTFAEGDVREIVVERRDSIANGALIGLAVSGWPALLCVATSGCYYNEVGAGNLIRVSLAIGAAVGTGVGAWIDYSIRKRVPVFLAPGRGSSGSSSFDELRPRLKRGDTLYVTGTDGRLTKGTLGALSADSLELLAPGPTPRLLVRDIREIQLERRDSVLNGLLIGLGSGAAGGAIGAINECRWDNCLGDEGRTIAGKTAVFGAIGAGIGLWIDWLRSDNERVTVYVAGTTRSASVQIAPLVSAGGPGVQISIRF